MSYKKEWIMKKTLVLLVAVMTMGAQAEARDMQLFIKDVDRNIFVIINIDDQKK